MFDKMLEKLAGLPIWKLRVILNEIAEAKMFTNSREAVALVNKCLDKDDVERAMALAGYAVAVDEQTLDRLLEHVKDEDLASLFGRAFVLFLVSERQKAVEAQMALRPTMGPVIGPKGGLR